MAYMTRSNFLLKFRDGELSGFLPLLRRRWRPSSSRVSCADFPALSVSGNFGKLKCATFKFPPSGVDPILKHGWSHPSLALNAPSLPVVNSHPKVNHHRDLVDNVRKQKTTRIFVLTAKSANVEYQGQKRRFCGLAGSNGSAMMLGSDRFSGELYRDPIGQLSASRDGAFG